MSFWDGLMGFLLAFPFFIYLILGTYAYLRKKEKKKTVFMLIDGSALFYWISIVALSDVRNPDGQAFIWVIASFLIAGGLLVALQYKVRGSIDLFRVVRSVWRLGFLISIAIYLWLITDTISMYMDMV